MGDSMRLKNKKTGEIKAFDEVMREAYKWNNYNSLTELTEEWEDYEEPKWLRDYWFIDSCGSIIKQEDDVLGSIRREIGNYFETKEEAEKAVEKLKAWKRLKDARFEFGTIKYNLDEESSSTISYDGIITIKGIAYEDFVQDLDLIFGGKE